MKWFIVGKKKVTNGIYGGLYQKHDSFRLGHLVLTSRGLQEAIFELDKFTFLMNISSSNVLAVFPVNFSKNVYGNGPLRGKIDIGQLKEVEPVEKVIELTQRLAQQSLAGEYTAHSDDQLLTRFVEHRDQAALEAIIRRHGPMVMGVCRRHLARRVDAEDAFQSAFLVLIRKATTIVPRRMLANWLYGTARLIALRAKAMNAKKRTREAPFPDQLASSPPVDSDLTELLDQELAQLPEKYRLPIILCDLDGQTHQEAARQLGWPVGTVSGRLSRGRHILAARLARRGVQVIAGAMLTNTLTSASSIPVGLISTTLRHGRLIMEQTAGESLPASVQTLTEGVLKVMLIKKLKLALAVVAVMVVGTTAIGLKSFTVAADTPVTKAKQEKPATEERKTEPDDKALEAKKQLQGFWKLVGTNKENQYLHRVGKAYLYCDQDCYSMFAEKGERMYWIGQATLHQHGPNSLTVSGESGSKYTKYTLEENSLKFTVDINRDSHAEADPKDAALWFWHFEKVKTTPDLVNHQNKALQRWKAELAVMNFVNQNSKKTYESFAARQSHRVQILEDLNRAVLERLHGETLKFD